MVDGRSASDDGIAVVGGRAGDGVGDQALQRDSPHSRIAPAGLGIERAAFEPFTLRPCNRLEWLCPCFVKAMLLCG